MRTTVHLPDDLLSRAKQKAAAEGRTLTSLIEEGLRLVVNARRMPRTSPKESGHLPLSKRSGGLLPGVDPIKLLQQDEEWADLEMLRRTSSQS